MISVLVHAMPPWRSRLLTVMFPPAVETGQRDAPGHEKISPSELVTGGPEGETGRPRQEEERCGGRGGDGAGQETQAEGGGGGRVQQDQQVRGQRRAGAELVRAVWCQVRDQERLQEEGGAQAGEGDQAREGEGGQGGQRQGSPD